MDQDLKALVTITIAVLIFMCALAGGVVYRDYKESQCAMQNGYEQVHVEGYGFIWKKANP